MNSVRKILRYLFKIIHILLLSIGSFALLITILAFTSLPYNTRYWLATHNSRYKFTPDYIIMLGGSGMPSEDNLIRLYYTANAAKEYPKAKIVIAHPYDSLVCEKMKSELLYKQIDTSRLFFVHKGTNTRSQVLEIQNKIIQSTNIQVITITAPEQIYRSVMSFRKVGYINVGGYPAMPCDMDVDLKYNSKKLKGSKYIPEVGNNLDIRYNFWNYLKLEITCLREFSAIVYYKLNGWI